MNHLQDNDDNDDNNSGNIMRVMVVINDNIPTKYPKNNKINPKKSTENSK